MAADPHPQTRAELARLYPPVAPALHAWACLRIRPDARRQLSPEDLTQEVWLRAFQVFASFDAAKCSFRAWLFMVAKHVLLEAQRRVRKSQREAAVMGNSTLLSALHDVPLEVTSITRRIAKDEQVQRFITLIDGLDEVDRMTVIHCGIEELSLADAAARLGESYAATAKRWQRLREQMRSWRVPLDLVAGA